MARSTAVAQDSAGADAPAAATEAEPGVADGGNQVPGSAWLMPFNDLARGEPIAWIIVLASVIAVTFIVQGFLRMRRPVLIPPESLEQIQTLIRQRQFPELVTFTSEDDSFVSRALSPALKRAPNLTEMRDALETAASEQTAEEFRRLEIIHLLANIGPLLGLLGTVVGIMEAFLEIRRAEGAAEVGNLAGGISMALSATALGLILAIMCLISYGILRTRADRLTQEGTLLAEELLLSLRTAPPTTAAVPTQAVPAGRAVAPGNEPARRAVPAGVGGTPATAAISTQQA